MPLYKTITVVPHTKLLIWNIKETYEQLLDGIELTSSSQQRVEGMKSELHRRGYLSVRQLLKQIDYTDYDLYYNDFGKPFLKDGTHISITHSFEFAAIIISSHPVGIDIEKQREKINRIAHKFVRTENTFLDKHIEQTRMLTVIWGAKEALYKLYATAGLSFEQHISIEKFCITGLKTKGTITYNDKISKYNVDFMEFEGFTCVYTLPIIT